MNDKLKYTVKTHINEETNNNLTTILENLNMTQEEFIRQAINEKLEKSLEKYRAFGN